MIRSVSRICRQWAFHNIKNQQPNRVTNNENISRIFSQPNLTFYSGVPLQSDKIEEINDKFSEIDKLLDQLGASHHGNISASTACSLINSLANSAPKDAFKTYFEASDSEKHPLLSDIVSALEHEKVNKAHTKELVSHVFSLI